MIKGVECRKGNRCRVQGAGCRVQGTGCRVQGTGYRVQGTGCRVQGTGYRVDKILIENFNDEKRDYNIVAGATGD